MKFIDFLQEDGEISTANVAGARGSLFGGIIKRTAKGTKFKKIPKITKLSEDVKSNTFASTDVISKLDDAEKSNEMKKNTVAYGIEDSDGNITKVYVDKEQDEEFKHALGELLQDDEQTDVAEILFNLRNSFKIIHVVWPKLPEDEEVDNKLENPDGAEGENPEDTTTGAAGEDTLPGGEGGDNLEPPVEDIGSNDNQSILLKVIDMLRADADAKAAESNAKAKEAEAEQAKLAIQMTNMKVKNEEDMLRAEEHFKKQSESKKEEDRLAKLAKYRNEINTNATYENKMNLLDLMTEDTTTDINNINTQIADLNVRKSRATKVFDDQIKRLQQQLANKTKEAQRTAPQLQNTQQQNQQTAPQLQPQR
jgi:hypothetical protein